MSIDYTNVKNSAYQYANNTISSVANSAAVKNVDAARNSTYNFLNANLPEVVTSTALSISQAINNNPIVQTVESYVGSPAQITAAVVGFSAGRAIAAAAPVTAAVSLIAATAFTGSRTDVAVVGLTTATSVAISLARRAIGI